MPPKGAPALEFVKFNLRFSTKDCADNWCPGPESNRYAPFTEATDFKSVVSTYFTTRASTTVEIRYGILRDLANRKPVAGRMLEAGTGIEPMSTDLQSAA